MCVSERGGETGIEESLWLSCERAGGTVAAGYNLIGNVDLDPNDANLPLCDDGSVGLFEIIVSDPTGQVILACGGLDNPCPVRSRSESGI